MSHIEQHLISIRRVLLMTLMVIGIHAVADNFDPNANAIFVEHENQSIYMKGFPPEEDKLINGNSTQWLIDDNKSRWAMQNISTFLHTAPVSRGHQRIVYLPRNDKPLLEKKFDDIYNKKSSLRQLLKTIEVDGFIALKNGEVIVEAYYNGYSPEKRHEMMSVNKSFTGTMIGVLVAEGKLDTAKLIPEYLPELKNTGWGDATLRQTLDMTTGVDWNEDETDEKSHIIQGTTAVGLQHVRSDYPFSNGISILKSVGKKYEHGKTYSYLSGNTEVLGWLITRVSNKHWQDVFSEKIWSKLGAERDALIVVDSGGQGAAHAGFNATLRDTARFGVMMAQNGYYNGQQIVSKEWVDDIRYGDDAVRRAWQGTRASKDFGDSAFYRSQYWVLDSDKGIFLARGFRGQTIYINISENLVGVFQSSAGNSVAITHQQLGIMQQISQYLKQGL